MQDFTDSYCERCGTRYTFGPPAARGRSMATARVLARGLKHFVMNDSSTIDDAMAAARVDEDRGTAAQITEEFHKVFSFCMTCRQYACEKCWNPNQSACLSCAPLWDTEPVAPQDHLIIRTAAAHPSTPQEPAATASESDLDEVLRRRSADLAASGSAAADLGPRTAGEIRREARRDQQAANQLRAQAESWKTQDDGWTLWPAEQPAEQPAAARSVTPDELLVVQTDLGTPTYQEPDEPQPRRKSSSKRASAPPETPHLQSQTDFDLLGSLREAGQAVPQGETAQPAPDAGPIPARGRLLGGQRPAVPAPGRGADSKPPKPPKPAKASKGKGRTPAAVDSGELWPHATPWSARPIARHDWGATPEPAQATPEPRPALEDEPGPAPEWEPPVRRSEPVASLAPEPTDPLATPLASPPALPPIGEQPPPAQMGSESPAGWLATARRFTQPQPQEPPKPLEPESETREPAPPLPPPATPSAAWAPAPRSQPAQEWQSIGANWPPRPSEPTVWPPLDADIATSMAARGQLDRAADEETARLSAMWAESAERVIDRGSTRVCYRCSLPLSTQARYCRRCGTNQQG